MFLILFAKKNVLSIIIIIVESFFGITMAFPINNGFSIKFNPIIVKEEAPSKITGVLFTKIPQDVLPKQDARVVLNEKIFPRSIDLAAGCTNQIARILFPMHDTFNELNDTVINEQIDHINVPVIKQDASVYNILVVSAPHNIKLGKGDAKPMLVYLVFPMDDSSESVNIPSIYFVNRSDGRLDLKSKEKVDPVLIIDNNRTVTGFKSKEVKFIRFKSKLSSR